MVGLTLDGKPIQVTIPLPNAQAILMVLNGINKGTSQHRFITFCTSGTHTKPGTSSYTITHRKTLPQSLPKKPTMMLPQTAPKTYHTYKTINYKENNKYY